MYSIADNRDLLADSVQTTPGLAHWPIVAAWWKERIHYVGPYGERTTVVFVPISADTGLDKVHPTWAGTYILNACVYLSPTIHFALIDSDCVPMTSFEIQELWRSSSDPVRAAECCRQMETTPSSPIAPAHKRARSVDTGKAMQPPEPPPFKLSKSRSVESLRPARARTPSPYPVGRMEDEVDYGGSERLSPTSHAKDEASSGCSSPAAQPSSAFAVEPNQAKLGQKNHTSQRGLHGAKCGASNRVGFG